MTKIYQRYSKRQANGTLIFEHEDRETCERWLDAEIKRISVNFITIDKNNRDVACAECFGIPKEDVTDDMATSEQVFDYVYNNFSEYYAILDEDK